MSKVFTSVDKFNEDHFPKGFEKERFERMSGADKIKEQSELRVSKIMKKMKRILKEGK